MATSPQLVLDRDYVGVRQRTAQPRPAAERRVVRPAAVAIRLSPLARLFKRIQRAYLGSAALMVVGFVAMLLTGPGWQAVAAAGAIFAGMGALIAFLVAVTLGDGMRSPR
jgi:hypothetical protein